MPNQYDYIECPHCGAHIWGHPNNIDSGLRKHLEFCEKRPPDDDAA